MTIRYRFPAWARENIGSNRPSEVKRWFAERRADYTTEFWRKALRRKPSPSIVLATWGEICDAAGVPLSAFFEIEPSPTPPPIRRRPRRRAAPVQPPPRPRPPRPGDSLRRTHA